MRDSTTWRTRSVHMLCLFLAVTLGGAASVQAAPVPGGIQFHHVFPQEFRMYFASHGINVDSWTIPLDQRTHNALHFKMDYNGRWKVFILANPVSTQPRIFTFAAALLAEAGIRGQLEAHDYRTRKPTGESFPPRNPKTKVPEIMENVAQRVRTAKALRALSNTVIVTGSAVLAYECYKVCEAMDDDFRGNSHVEQCMECLVRAVEAHDDGKEDASLKEMGKAWFHLAYAHIEKYILYRTEFFKEVANCVTGQRDRYLAQAERFLDTAIKCDPGLPEALLYRGFVALQKGDSAVAQGWIDRAEPLFREAGSSISPETICRELQSK